MTSTGTASIMSLWSLITTFLRLHDLYWSSSYYVTMTLLLQYLSRHHNPMATASTTSLCTLLLQQLSLWSYDYSIHNVPMISIATASIMPLCLDCYSIYYVFMISLVTTSTTSQWSPLLQHLIRRNILLNTIGRTALLTMLSNEQPFIPDYGSRLTLPKLPREPTGCASPGAAGGTHCPRPCPRLCHLCYHIVFCVLPFVLSDIPGPRLISREDAHPMYPRYPRVFLFVMIYCPLPHQFLWERLGVSLSCTCVAFSSFC